MAGKRINRVGEKYPNNQGYEMEIIKCDGTSCCTVKFNDIKNTVVECIQFIHIREGNVRNPNHPSKYGVGYEGQGIFTFNVDKKETKCSKTFSSMLERCHSEKYQIEKPSYIGCSINNEWHNFQNFAEWYYKNYKKNWKIDKDILVKGNKIYSPETCCFVPNEINCLFTKSNRSRGSLPIGVSRKGKKFEAKVRINNIQVPLGLFYTPKEAFNVYKIAKEKEIKRIADKWKDQIEPKVYDAMYSYVVEITD